MLKIKKNRKKQKGMAALEIIPIMVVVVILLNYTLGFFGAIHSGILNSIAARNYAFETFRQRSNLTYFRETPTDNSVNYYKEKFRFHGIIGENAKSKGSDSSPIATTRYIAFAPTAEKLGESGSAQDHNKGIDTMGTARNEKYEANPIWIKTAYGICINHDCGD